jgi:hypothetical protein
MNLQQCLQYTYKRGIEMRSHNHCCRVKGNKYYIYCVCVCSLSYPAYNAHAPFHFVICGLSDFTILFPIISQTARFSERNLIKKNVRSHLLYNFVCSTSNSKNNSPNYYQKRTLVFT